MVKKQNTLNKLSSPPRKRNKKETISTDKYFETLYKNDNKESINRDITHTPPGTSLRFCYSVPETIPSVQDLIYRIDSLDREIRLLKNEKRFSHLVNKAKILLNRLNPKNYIYKDDIE